MNDGKDKALKTEDRAKVNTNINPEKLLESLGIGDYLIDWDEKTIFLNRRDMNKVAVSFDKFIPVTQAAYGVYAVGWWFSCEKEGVIDCER